MSTPALKVPGPTPLRELCLLVIAENSFETHPLPERGSVTIGSHGQCDVVVPEGSVAARHARLDLAAFITLTDLGTAEANTTTVGDRAVPTGATWTLAQGEVFRLGAVMFLVQRRSRVESRRIWSHGYFELRVEEECLRAERYGRHFAILRVKVETDLPSAQIEERISRLIRSVDIVASYSAHAYELMLCETDAVGAKLVAQRLRESFAELGPVTVRMAQYGLEGRTPDALLAALTLAQPQAESAQPAHFSPARGPMHDLRQLVQRVAASTINVLIFGETGVGKEHLAGELHRLSARANKMFLGLNVAAIPETLLESELFGHERGAFTGANVAKPGLIESAEGGTLFLDEVGDLPLSVQVKLLRVLETREVLRVGGIRPKKVDVRLVAASNVDLEAAVAEGRFREDLFFRLNGVGLQIPPLRERISELEGLARAFVREACSKFDRKLAPDLAPESLRLLEGYRWPGNIRELRNVIERSVVVCDGAMLLPEHFPVEKLRGTFVARKTAQAVPGAEGPKRKSALGLAAAPQEAPSEEAQRRAQILAALATCAGNQTRAAEQLGVSRRTLVNWMNAYAISGPRKHRSQALKASGPAPAPSFKVRTNNASRVKRPARANDAAPPEAKRPPHSGRLGPGGCLFTLATALSALRKSRSVAQSAAAHVAQCALRSLRSRLPDAAD